MAFLRTQTCQKIISKNIIFNAEKKPQCQLQFLTLSGATWHATTFDKTLMNSLKLGSSYRVTTQQNSKGFTILSDAEETSPW